MTQPAVRCSFCAKDEAAVNKIIAGPGTYICDGCVALCNTILEEDRQSGGEQPRLPGWESMSDEEYFDLLEASVHNPNGLEAVLGKYYVPGTDSYVAVAEGKHPPATYFSLGDDWGTIADAHNLSDKDMFDAFNVPFLERMMAEGKPISFSHNPLDFPDSALGDELQFLRDNGYVFDPATMQAYLP